MSFANARFLWEDGAGRLRAAPPDLKPTLERVVDRVVEELRRRLGGPFAVDELVELHAQGLEWVQDLAVRIAPDEPRAWDEQTVGNAAFWHYARSARDFAGGRRTSA